MGSVCSLSMRSMLHARWLEKTLSALYLAVPYRCLQGARRGSTLENAGRDDLGGFSVFLHQSCCDILVKKSSTSSRPHFLNVGLVWPLLSKRVPCCMLHALSLEKDFSSSYHLHRQPFQLCCLSALYFACPYHCLQRAREGSTLQNAGRDDLGGFSTPVLLRCFCSKKCSKSSRVIPRPFSHCWGRVYLTSWLSESARNYVACFRVGDTMRAVAQGQMV